MEKERVANPEIVMACDVVIILDIANLSDAIHREIAVMRQIRLPVVLIHGPRGQLSDDFCNVIEKINVDNEVDQELEIAAMRTAEILSLTVFALNCGRPWRT